MNGSSDYSASTNLTSELTFTLAIAAADGDTLKAQATATFTNGRTMGKIWNVGVGSTGGGGLTLDQAAQLEGIAIRTATGSVVLRSLVATSGELHLNQHSDYKAAYSNAISFSNDGTFGDLTNATVHLLISQVVGKTAVVPPIIDVAGTVQGYLTNPSSITFELTAIQTALLTSLEPKAYQYEAWAVFSGGQRPLIQATDCTAIWGRPTA